MYNKLENNWIETALLASQKASAAIMKIYLSDDFELTYKSDETPLTKADNLSNKLIQVELEKTGLPVLSEEGKSIPFDTRKKWEYYWLVDPLDGTKEFLKHNGEFTVNIALIHKDKPVWGVVEAPALDKCYYLDIEGKVWLKEKNECKQLSPKDTKDNIANSGVRIIASRSHMDVETKEFIDRFSSPEIVSMGSSLKFMMLAENKADMYVRYAPTMEWDTAAAHAILNALGWELFQQNTNNPLQYNKLNLLNPGFLVN